MRLVQPAGNREAQFLEIVNNALDKRQFSDITTAGADVEFSIEHRMGVIPLGYLVIQRNKAGQTYLSATPADTQKIYLKDSAATVALRVLVF